MFVAKVAVVGAGTLAEGIAAAIAKAGLPVVSAGPEGPWDGFGDIDLAIEAIAEEEIVAKQDVFAELDVRTPEHAILASASALVSVTEVSDATSRPDRVVGLHFSGRRLVEVVEGEDTAPETAQAAANFVQAIRRQPVRCAECPGFVLNRVLMAAVVADDAAELFGEEVVAAARARTNLAQHLVESYGDRFSAP